MLYDPEKVGLPVHLTGTQVLNARWLVRRMAADDSIANIASAAYMLATVEHETWARFSPVEEVGRGTGKPYGIPLEVVCADGTVRQNCYYGRGYVQLTWQANYAKMGNCLGIGRTLMDFPEKALETTTAYSLMSVGMMQGSFTGKSLRSYLNEKTTDYVHARRVINGLDCAEHIAGLAEDWEQRLRNGLHVALTNV